MEQAPTRERTVALPPAWLDLARVLKRIADNHADDLRALRQQAKGEAA